MKTTNSTPQNIDSNIVQSLAWQAKHSLLTKTHGATHVVLARADYYESSQRLVLDPATFEAVSLTRNTEVPADLLQTSLEFAQAQFEAHGIKHRLATELESNLHPTRHHIVPVLLTTAEDGTLQPLAADIWAATELKLASERIKVVGDGAVSGSTINVWNLPRRFTNSEATTTINNPKHWENTLGRQLFVAPGFYNETGHALDVDTTVITQPETTDFAADLTGNDDGMSRLANRRHQRRTNTQARVTVIDEADISTVDFRDAELSTQGIKQPAEQVEATVPSAQQPEVAVEAETTEAPAAETDKPVASGTNSLATFWNATTTGIMGIHHKTWGHDAEAEAAFAESRAGFVAGAHQAQEETHAVVEQTQAQLEAIKQQQAAKQRDVTRTTTQLTFAPVAAATPQRVEALAEEWKQVQAEREADERAQAEHDRGFAEFLQNKNTEHQTQPEEAAMVSTAATAQPQTEYGRGLTAMKQQTAHPENATERQVTLEKQARIARTYKQWATARDADLTKAPVTSRHQAVQSTTTVDPSLLMPAIYRERIEAERQQQAAYDRGAKHSVSLQLGVAATEATNSALETARDTSLNNSHSTSLSADQLAWLKEQRRQDLQTGSRLFQGEEPVVTGTENIREAPLIVDMPQDETADVATTAGMAARSATPVPAPVSHEFEDFEQAVQRDTQRADALAAERRREADEYAIVPQPTDADAQDQNANNSSVIRTLAAMIRQFLQALALLVTINSSRATTARGNDNHTGLDFSVLTNPETAGVILTQQLQARQQPRQPNEPYASEHISPRTMVEAVR